MGAHISFARIAMNEATEETVIKETKTPRGIKSCSLKSGAVVHYFFNADYRRYFSCMLEKTASFYSTINEHKDL